MPVYIKGLILTLSKDADSEQQWKILKTCSIEPHIRKIRMHITKLNALLLRAPIAEPLRTSVGVLHSRPALLVRAEDTDGAVGWGEIWCVFPPCGAEHRAALVETLLAPIVNDQAWDDPAAAYRGMTEATHIVT